MKQTNKETKKTKKTMSIINVDAFEEMFSLF